MVECLPNQGYSNAGKILADDFVLVNPAGMQQTKRDNLQNVLDPAIETTAISFDSVQVRLIKPDVAILTAFWQILHSKQMVNQ